VPIPGAQPKASSVKKSEEIVMPYFYDIRTPSGNAAALRIAQ
jgi:hypothetical protein